MNYVATGFLGTVKIYPEYYLYMKENDDFLMAGKKRPNNKVRKPIDMKGSLITHINLVAYAELSIPRLNCILKRVYKNREILALF